LILPAEDCSDYDIGQFFDASFEFIESGRRQGGVLVHCMAGISRSAAILAAYLIKKQGISAQEAVKLLQEKRKQVCPNEGFMRQLSRY
jgi:dual specificity MAP kinase phosphatase